MIPIGFLGGKRDETRRAGAASCDRQVQQITRAGGGIHRSTVVLAALSALLLVSSFGCSKSGSSGTGSNETVTVTFADIGPKTHFVSQGLTLPFISNVEKMAKQGGQTIKIKYYPDQQLGKAADNVNGLNNGVFQLAQVTPAYNDSQMPLGNVFNLPRLAKSPTALALAYYKLSQDHSSVIYKTDFEKNHLVPVMAYALPLYQLVSTKPITDVDSLKGLPIRSAGGVQDDIVKALGGTPVQLTTPEQYSGLQQGIIDGGIFNLPSLISNKTGEVTKSFTTNANVSSYDGAFAFSDAAWGALPKWAQGIFIKAGKQATDKFAKAVVGVNTDAINELKKMGLTSVEFDATQSKKLDELLKSVKQQWINDMKAIGVDGKAAVSEAEAALKQVE